jgi:hypothetical protein
LFLCCAVGSSVGLMQWLGYLLLLHSDHDL